MVNGVRLAGLLFCGLLVAGPLEAAFDSVTDTGSGPVQIRRVIPSGEDVPPARQIVIEFDRPMVPIGRMARDPHEIPIAVSAGLLCQWRWLNTSSLACQLGPDEALIEATRYTVHIGTGLTAMDGEGMSEPYSHTFITQRPDVRRPSFVTWRSPGFPVIRLVFNQAVNSKSVARHVFFRSEGDDSTRVGVDVYADTTDPSHLSLIALPDGKTTYGFQPDVAPELRGGGAMPSRSWLVAPRRELTLDSRFDLYLEAGLESSVGPELGAASRVIVQFDTFPEFDFVGVKCLATESNHWELIPRETEPQDQVRCDPLRGAGLVFSAPVPHQEIKQHVAIDPDLAGGRTDYDPWANRYSHSRLNWPHQKGQNYVVWLPERLVAYRQYQLTSPREGLRDEFGRFLSEALDMTYMTDHRRPNLVLTHRKAVLEKALTTEVPLYVTNLARVEAGFTTLTTEGHTRAIRRVLEVPAVEDVSFAIPAQIRQMLEGKSGAVSGYLKGRPSDRVKNNLHTFFATVTPFQVHAKLGHFSSLVWVTDMSTGEPVSGATLSIDVATYAGLSGPDTAKFGRFETNHHGLAVLPGLETIDPELSLINNWHDSDPRWFLRVEIGDNLGLLPLDRHFRVWSYGVGGYPRRQFGHIHTWGTTAQGVYRAGDTIQYKLYVRNQDTRRFVAPPPTGYRLKIIDPQGKELTRLDHLVLSEFGAYEGEVEVPANAPVGWYQFRLEANFSTEVWSPLRVLVSEFTPSPFRVTAQISGDVFSPGDQVTVTTLGRLHSGGPYIDAETRVTARLKAHGFYPTHPVAKQFFFDTFTPGHRNWVTLHKSVTNLDQDGDAETSFKLQTPELQYGTLQIETSVRDDRGKYIADVASARYVGRDRFVGLRNTKWLYEEDEPAEVEYLVVDTGQRLVEDVEVVVVIEREQTTAARVKGAGNAYLTQYDRTWVEIKRCLSVSAIVPGRCEFSPGEPGAYRATATITDTKGRAHSTRVGAWVRGKGRVTWSQPNDFQLSIIAEKETWSVGETARYLVRNQIPGALALVTIERYGILDSWSQTFDTATPVVEFEVTPDYVPGFYLSVVIVSPRVAAPLGPDLVDLGKPTFRMGYVKSPVEDPFKRIDIAVTTDRETYKPRETVNVAVQTSFRDESTGEPVELAVAVLDEAVFDLIAQGAGYFDPYAGFYRLEALDVLNFDTLKRLQRLLRDDVLPSFYNRGMSSSVRAVALAALAPHGSISLNELMRYESHVPYMTLFAKAHYLDAANSTHGSEPLLASVLEQIEAHASASGGKFQFNKTIDDGYRQLLATSMRSNCAILTGLTALGERNRQRVGDLPFKLVRAITLTRGNRDHWQNTQENVFCMNALIEFSRVYEQIPPRMRVTAALDSASMGENEFTDIRDEAVTFSRDLREGDPGQIRKVRITREGDGRLYYATRLRYAPLLQYARRTNAGIDIRREYSVQRDDKWVLLEQPFNIERGELVRVDIYVSLPTARHFVVVDDPVPGGLEPVNRDLATTSVVDAEAGDFNSSGGSWWYNFDDWRGFGYSRWSFYHRELRHDAVRFFSDYLPAGNYHLSYSAQAIATGVFKIAPVHSEEMYDPDVFGKGRAGTLKVTQ